MKRILVGVMVLMLLISGTVIAEEANPSPSIRLVGLLGGAGVSLDEGFVIQVDEQQDEEVKALFNDMSDFAKDGHIVDFFGFDADARNTLQEMLPEGVDLTSLQMDEFFKIVSWGYESTYGDVDALFDFMTDYPDGTALVAVVGIFENENVTWTPVTAVAENKLVRVTFTQDVLEKLQDNEAVLTLLRAA